MEKTIALYLFAWGAWQEKEEEKGLSRAGDVRQAHSTTSWEV